MPPIPPPSAPEPGSRLPPQAAKVATRNKVPARIERPVIAAVDELRTQDRVLPGVLGLCRLCPAALEQRAVVVLAVLGDRPGAALRRKAVRIALHADRVHQVAEVLVDGLRGLVGR